MKKIILYLSIITLISCGGGKEFEKKGYNYPKTEKVESSYTLHGVKINDPYSWLEDSKSEKTKKWVGVQNRFTDKYLRSIPQRELLKKRYSKLFNYEKYSVPTKKGEYYYYHFNNGLQNQSIFYRKKGENGKPEVVLDPNKLSKDGTKSLGSIYITKDGSLMAYGVSQSGSDWQKYYIYDIENKKHYKEELQYTRWASIAWKKDKSGFYYGRYPDPKTVKKGEESFYHKVYYHKLGTDQSEDVLIYGEDDHKKRAFSPYITYDGEFLTITVWEGTDPRNLFYLKKVDSDKGFIKLFDKMEAKYYFIGNIKNVFYFLTDKNAPNGKIIAFDLENMGKEPIEILPERKLPLEWATFINGELIACYMEDVKHTLHRYEKDGSLIGQIELPTLGTVAGLSGKIDQDFLFLNFTSFLYPQTIFKYTFSDNKMVTYFKPKLDFNPKNYETKQIFYKSKDGKKVPMFLVHKKGLKLDGNNPTLLYGYGGFNNSMTPYFSTSRVMWLENGGIYALANIRGGGEYGETWHQEGILDRKQNVFDDFIYAAKWLIKNSYTKSEKLAIMGGSNGGLLVAAVMVQQPELFGAVVCMVPLTDMLKYHKFSVGHYWIPEYGNAERSKKEFDYLYKYSPYHNVKKANYPAALISSADTDDRVAPLHAKKFAAMVQENTTGKAPIILKIETKAGHGHGKPTAKIIEEIADIYGFLFGTFGMEVSVH